MSDTKLFLLKQGKAEEIYGSATTLEKEIQTLIERNLETLMGVRFVASEHSTGRTHAGRIDTLGLDENNCPVLIEYKRHSSESVTTQGLYYLDWLFDHQAEFKLLVLEKFGKTIADGIDWSATRLVCIAAEYSKFDKHAVQQFDRNIELLRYRMFGKDLLLLELVNAKTGINTTPKDSPKATTPQDKPVSVWLAELEEPMQQLFTALDSAMYIGEDVQRKDLQLYIAYKRIKNFATVVFRKNVLFVYATLDPSTVGLVSGFTRDVTKIGHHGTGNLEITIKTEQDLQNALPLLELAYQGGYHAE
jgi:predicted transport protein